MRTGLYQIFDRIATMPVSPIVGFQREEAAVRWFQEVAGMKESPVNKYPEDHTLLEVGHQDIESGTVEGQVPKAIYDGRDMVREMKERLAVTSVSAPAANTNGAANADTEVLPQPTPEELSCQRCRKHFTMHVNNGLCPDNSGARFLPSPQLQQHYNTYLAQRAQQS